MTTSSHSTRSAKHKVPKVHKATRKATAKKRTTATKAAHKVVGKGPKHH